MAKKESSQQASEQQEGKVDRIDNALQKFSDMLIARMEQMKESKWKKGWTDGRTAQFGLPQNLVGRPYTGSNAFLCQIHTTMEHYRMPVYLTIKQIRDAGAMIKKGEHSIPIFKWDLRIKDKDGKKLSESDYRNMTKEEQAECTVRPYLKVYNEWNIDQTNLEEVNKEKYDTILKRFKSEPIKDEVGMYKNEAFDNLLKEQSWVCPIEYEKFNESAFYSPKRDQIVVPSKKQFNISNTPEDVFKDGMEFYGTTIHEMAHSTGHESRLGRDGIVKIDQFGSDQYAKEELVAELTSALIGNAMGFDSRIRENNIAYLQNWIGSLKKDPKFLKSVMSDVNKSSKMVLEHIDEQRRKLGEKALLDGSLDGVEEKNKNEQQLEELKEEDAKKEVVAKVWPSVNNKITMPSGDILTVDYNKEKDTLEVAYTTSEGEEKTHSTNYDHSQDTNQNLGYVWEELSNMKQFQKKEESKEASEATAKALTHAALLVGALSAAKQNEGIWMNKSQKGNAEFINTHTPITAYNNIMMNLNSDANKYKTNVYTYYNPAKENNMPVKQNEKGMEFHWTSWGYQNAMDKDEVITSKQFDKLPDDEKSFYTKHATRVVQNIYNVEQTTMNANNHDAYVEILKNKGAQLSQNEKEQKGKYSSIMKQWKELKGKHPDALLLFRIGDFYEMYKQDAKRGSEVLGITLTKMNGSKDFYLAGFPHQALDIYLPKLIRAGERVAICDQLESKKTVSQSFDAKAILNKAYATAKEVAKQSGMQYERVMVLQDAKYDSKEDKIVVSGMKGEVGNEKMAALYKANDIYRAVVAATGTENRLDRSDRNNLLPEDDAKHEQLVRELAAGVMMARQGLPAILSKENEKLIPYWEREIKENPKLLGIVERDVNNAVETIDNLVAKRKVDYESIRGQLPEKTMEKPSKYSISQDLAKLPNIETKEIVVVKDILRKEADVILPAGASLEVNNEVPGMRKDRITIALKKEGIDDVRFYNAGGSLGLNKPNSYFQGKEVTLNNLKQYELVPHHTLDVEKQAAPKKEVIIKNFQAIKDDNGRYAFFIKPENEPSFSVYPAKEHLNTFYNVIKTDKQAIVHDALAQRYYEMATKHPDTKLDLITPKKVDVDMKLIERPSITSSAQDAKQKLIFATINGQRVQAPINKQQWQKMWLAEDMGAYKRALAAVIFEPMLKRGMEEEQSQQAVSESEKVEIKEKPAPENKVQETVTETHRTGLHM